MSVSEIIPSEDMLHEAMGFMSEDQEEKGLELVDRFLNTYPENIPALHVKACLLLDLERNEEVLRVCNKIQNLINPAAYSNEEYGIPFGFVHMIQSMSHLDLENDEQAMKCIQTAININKIAPYVFVRAMVHFERSDLKAAVKDMVFVFSHPHEGKMMDNSTAEINEIFKEVSSAVKELLEENHQESVEISASSLRIILNTD